MKYPTTEQSLKMFDHLQKVGFDLERWEELERKKLLVELGVEKRMGEDGFELMDLRMMIQDANEMFGEDDD